MSIVHSSTVQSQTSAAIQKAPPEQTQKPVKTAADTRGGHPATFPEDIVNLSTSQAVTLISSKGIQPSTPVTNSEKSTLLKTSSGRTGFSTFA